MLEKLSVDIQLDNDGGAKIALMDMDFSSLNIFTGMNSAGKSIIMKMAWFISYMLQGYKASFLMGFPNWEKQFKEEVDLAFRYTFHSSESISGYIEASDKDRQIFSFILSFKEGELDRFNLDIINHEKFRMGDIVNVAYASNKTRSFLAYKQYIRLKKALQISNLLTSSNLEKICEIHPLYDVLWFEKISAQLDKYMEEGIGNADQEMLAKYTDLIFSAIGRTNDIETFTGFAKSDDPKEDGEIFLTFSTGRRDKLSIMSEGTQSLIMLTFFGGY
jgi:hypothetical protein